MGILKYCLLAIALISCADRYLQVPAANNRKTESNGAKLSGRVQSLEGSLIDLSAQSEKAWVIQFASDGCLSCAKEAKAFRGFLKNPLEQPKKIQLISILVATEKLDAEDWRERLKVSWPVALDSTGEIFKKYCPLDQVPCVVVYVPGEENLWVTQKEVTPEEISKITGPWE